MKCLSCRNTAQVELLCVSCAMVQAVRRGNPDGAFAIAKAHGRLPSAVRTLIRDHNEERAFAEASAAIREGKALAAAPTARAAISSMRDATRDMLAAVNSIRAA